MNYLVTMYKYKRNRYPCDEQEIKIWLDPSRRVTPLDDSFLGQIMRLFRVWGEL